MKRYIHKLLAFLLALVMLFEAAPMAVLAEGSDDQAKEQTEQTDETNLAVDAAQTSFGITLPKQHTLTADEYSVAAVKDDSKLDELINLIAPPAPTKRFAAKKAAAVQASTGGNKTGYVAYDIDLTKNAEYAESYQVTVDLSDSPVDMLAGVDGDITIEKVSYTLYHIHEDSEGNLEAEKEELTPIVEESQDGKSITGFTFTTNSFSYFLLKYTVDFVYRSAEGKICVNFENLQENSNELSHISYDKIQKVTMLPVADILADAPVKTDDEQDCSEVYVVYLHDGTAKEEFDKEFFSQAAVSIEGKGVEYSEGSIRLTGDVPEGKVTLTSGYKTLEVEISNYIAPPVVPEDAEAFTYRFFAVGETAAVADILAANEIVSSYYNIMSLSDEKAVTIEKDGSLAAQDSFDAVTLTVALSDGSEVEITLSNPAPVQAGETVATNGIGSFAATEEVPAGTMLVVNDKPVVPDGIVLPGSMRKGGPAESDPVFFEVSLVGPDGEPVKAGADVTLNTAIELPEAPEGQIVKVTSLKVYHIDENGEAEELKGATYALAEGKISSVSFTTPGFSLFAITYTVEYIDINYNGVINLDFTGFEPYPKEGVDATFIYDTDNCDIRVSVESVLSIALNAEAAGDGVISEKAEIENFEIDWTKVETVFAEGFAALEEGVLVISGDGSIVLSDGEKTLTINITGITKLSEEILKADGVEIKVEEGNIPLGSQAKYTQNNEEKTASLVEEHKLGEGEENIAGYSSADLKIVRNDEPVNAEGQFKVTLEKSSLIPEGMKLDKLYHIHDGEVEELAVAENNNGQLEFTMSNFSDIVASYTVDFHYQGVDYSIEGNSQILLSALIDQMNITNAAGEKIAVADVASVSFSDEHLVTVQQVSGLITYNNVKNVDVGEKDFLLSSLESFSTDEVLTLTLVNGEIIEVGVTDPITDLSAYLKSAAITGAETGENGLIVKAGVPYNVDLKFGTNNGLLFNQAAETMTYNGWEGFSPADTSGTATINGTGGDVTFDYTISNGVLTIHWHDMDSEAFRSFASTDYSEFELHITGVITENPVKFSETITQEVTIDDTAGVTINKYGSYNPETNAIDYTIDVSASGINHNIHIGDTITGTALTYNNDLVVTSSTGNSVSYTADTQNGETFGIMIGSMSHGETVTLKYSAAVNLSGVTGQGTVEQTGNDATVKSQEDNTPHTSHSDGGYLHNKISATSIGKSAGTQSIENGKTYIPWAITVNEAANASMAGVAITDEITTSNIMRYYGSGIHVEKYNKDGSSAGSYDVPWDEMTKTDSSWSYTIPSGDTGNYKYVITYHTEVDSDDLFVSAEVKNKATEDYNGTSIETWGGQQVEPTGETITASKQAVNTVVDKAHQTAWTTWEVKFTVPADGLSSCVVTDTYPVYSADSNIRDTLKTGEGFDVTVTPALLSGERVAIDTNDPTKAVLTFYKTENGSSETTGLIGTGAEREITVTLTTECNSEWARYTEQWQKNHVNNATVAVNGQNINVSDDVDYDFTEKTLTKAQTGTGTKSVDGTNVDYPPYWIEGYVLPAFRYEVMLTGINEAAFGDSNSLEITDTFDPTYVCFDENTEITENCYVHGGDVYYALRKKAESRTIPTVSASGNTLTFTISKDSLPKDGSNYYDTYTLVYYLTVKDRETLARMNQDALANKGVKVSFDNTASAVDFGSSTVTTDYTTDVLSKTYQDKGMVAGSGYEVAFTVNVNPNALKIGSGDTITLTDSYRNLSLDYTTINIEPDDGVNVNRSGNSIIFTLKNETAYVITYTTRVLGTQQVTWYNEANLEGQIESNTGTSTVNSSAYGSSTAYNMKVLKHAEGNIRQGLEARFDLYERYNGGAWTKILTFDTDPATGEFDIQEFPGADGTSRRLRRWSHHNENGDEIQDANEKYEYYIVETRAPAGYTLDKTHYTFKISDFADYSNWVFMNNDTVAIVNKPSNDISVEKTWINADGTTSWPEGTSVTFTLKKQRAADGSVSDLTAADLGKSWNGFVKDKTFTSAPEEALWTALPALPDGYSYVVVESAVSGYETYVKGENDVYKQGNTAAIINQTAAFANTSDAKTRVDVEKVWDPAPATSAEAKVTVQLKRTRTPVFGVETAEQQAVTEAGAVNVGEPVEITYDDTEQKWAYAYENLPKYEAMTGNGSTVLYEYTYEVEEVGATLNGADASSIYNKNEAVVTPTNEGVKVSITNSYEETYEEETHIKVTAVKQWKDSAGNIITDAAKLPENAQADFALRRYISYEAPDPNWEPVTTGTCTIILYYGNENEIYQTTANIGEKIQIKLHSDDQYTQLQKYNVYQHYSQWENVAAITPGDFTYVYTVDGNAKFKINKDYLYGISGITLTNLDHPATPGTVTNTVPDTSFNSDNSIRVQLPFGGNWSKAFPAQPKTGTSIIEGENYTGTYTYYVEELGVNENSAWAVEYERDTNNNIVGTAATGSLTVTNVLKKNLTVTKAWKNDQGAVSTWPKDGENYSPASIVVQLQRRIAGGEFEDVPGETRTIWPEEDTELGQGTQAVFSSLPMEDENHKAYEYRAVETTSVPGYTSLLEDNGDGTMTIVNEPGVTVTVSKTWDESVPAASRPAALQFTVYVKGEDNALTVAQVEGNPMVLTAPYSGSVTLSGLPKFDENGTEIAYVIKETGAYFGQMESGALPEDAEFVPASMYTVTGEGDLSFTDGNATAALTNTAKTVNVPLEKAWVDVAHGNFASDEYDWWAEFILEKLEVLESGEAYVPTQPGEQGPVSEWTPVDGNRERLEKGGTLSFNGLPIYKSYPNGSVYRIEYSVDEVAYEVKQGSNVISSRDKEYPNDTSKNQGDVKYSPVFIQDAGENEELRGTEDWYKIILNNTEEKITRVKDIDLSINKTWENGALNGSVSEDEAFARFELVRVKKEIYRSYTSNYDPTSTVTHTASVTVNGTTSSITVPKGAKIYILATFKPGNDGNGTSTFKYNNHDYSMQRSGTSLTVHSGEDRYYEMGDNDFTINVEQPQYLESVELTQAMSSPTATESVIDTFTLRKNPGSWQKNWTGLVALEEDALHENNQTAFEYSYYFREVEMNPAGFGASFKSGDTPLGDAGHQVKNDANITVENRAVPPFKVQKKWHEVEDPENYPEIRFTLYQGLVNGNQVSEGVPFVDQTGQRFENIPLNAANDWTWTCPVYLPEKDGLGRDVGYYVVEMTDDQGRTRVYQNSTVDANGRIVTAGAELNNNYGDGRMKPADYYNDQNSNHAATNDQNLPEGWNGGIDGNTGTLTILNRSPKYMQMDIKKKVLLTNENDGSVATIMDDADFQKNIVLEIQLKRLVFNADTGAQISGDWENFGTPFMIGFDGSGNPIQKNDNQFTLVKQGGFFWRIILDQSDASAAGVEVPNYGYGQDIGLPAYGYYKQGDTIIPVRYRYIPFEIGIWSDLQRHVYREGYEWFIGLQPNAWDGNGSQVPTFAPMEPNHDQDRIKNIMASDMYVEKVWEDNPTNIEEVYIKLYRSIGTGGKPEDFTQNIANRTGTFSQYGFVDNAEYLSTIQNGVLVMKSGSDPIHIHGLPLVYDDKNYLTEPYYYWIKEIGYKTKDGHTYFADDDVARFDPQYDKWDASKNDWSGNWTSNPREAATSLGRVSRNRLRASNRPFTDIRVQKEWYDEHGQKLNGPWHEANVTQVTFKVTQIATKYVKGQPTGTSVSKVLKWKENGSSTASETLTITAQSKRARVKPEAAGSSVYSVEYLTGTSAPMVETGSNWMTYVDGLETKFVDPVGDEWHFTYEITEVGSIDNCDSTVTMVNGAWGIKTATIKNQKIVTSLAIQKIFDGNAAGDLTDDQKKKIYFTVVGVEGTCTENGSKLDEFNNKWIHGITFNYGVNPEQSPGHPDAHWNGDTLVIKDIPVGEYIITEHYHTPGELFGPTAPGASYTHTWSYRVGSTEQAGSSTDSGIHATTEHDKLTRVIVTNTYEKATLEITKTITGDLNELPVGKTLTFTISPAAGLTKSTFIYPNDFTNDGKLTLTQKDGVKPDTVYTVTETGDVRLAGYTRTTTITTSAGGDPIVRPESSRLAIAGSDKTDADDYLAQINFENKYVQKKINIPVEKVWEHKDGTDTWPTGVSVKVTLYKQVGESQPVATGKEHTLTGSETSYTFENLPEYEGETVISYTVDEQIIVASGATFDPAKYTKIITGDIDDGFTITNKEEDQKGALSITKNVTVNGATPAGDRLNMADGTYTFSIAGPSTDMTVVKYVQITVTDGKAVSYKVADGPTKPDDWSTVAVAATFASDATTREAVVSDLAAGDYTITETAVPGMTTTVSGGKERKDNDNARSITVTVTAGETVAAEAQATFTNNKNVGDLELTKLVSGEGADANKKFVFTIDLTPPAGETLAASYGAEHTGDTTLTSVTVADGKITDIQLKKDETITIKGLPAGTGYTITEDDYSADGYSPATTKGSLTGTITGGTKAKEEVEVTNTRDKTSEEATKAWSDGTQSVAWPADVQSVEFTLYKTVNGKKSAVTADDLFDATGFTNPATIESTTPGLKASWPTLPTKMKVTVDAVEADSENGTEASPAHEEWMDITYTVEETKVTYTEASGKNALTTPETIAAAYNPTPWTENDKKITNTLPGSVQVTKTFTGIEATQIPTNFQIKAKLGAGDESPEITLTLGGYTDTGSLPTGVTVEKAADSLTWTISGLPIGTVVTFTEENYTVAGYNVTSTVSVNGGTPTVGISGTATAAVTPGTVAITNEYVAGVELPATGGPGTLPYTLTGLSLILGASLWLILRRRKEQQN